MPDHILRHRELVVDLPIMNLEFEAHEVREDSCSTSVSFDGWCGGLTWTRSYDRQPNESIVRELHEI